MENVGNTFNMDYGTKVTTDYPHEAEIMEINPEVMIEDYAVAYTRELQRRNPVRYESVAKRFDFEEELDYYFKGLIAIRVQSINNNCPVWRQARQLWIPAWIQFVIRSIGVFIDHDYGIHVIPSYSFDYDIEKMLQISRELEAFRKDGIAIFQEAFPYSKEGDREVMSMAIVNDYVNSMSKDSHPIASYVCAFIGGKVSETCAIASLYRVRYDDVAFIKEMLIHDPAIY